ncbi:antibiotic biosynthesis monooxygenase family protein [Nonomuraea aridisoli]|uniref:Antibiotic biosynthesis monooxygenase n=1 Tax=Nonomuraea aridisoli TaxID=2070368 RepID=A0A2W2FDB1_9ACTN|nr:antibiotic biosynthesis monooxygenase [Nonomuraea aridisoli]PZG19647.1 antibiotic biosynthesis monooxygenase [Nonomuraea aridisoli]
MILRIWSARATEAGAGDYHRYFETTLLPELRKLPGFRSGHLLARQDGDVVALTTHTFWDSEDAVRVFAGDDLTKAVVEPEARAFLLHMDTEVTHWNVLTETRA